MSIRAHLKDAPVPLAENVTILANCGVEVPNARFLCMWDEQEMGEGPTVERRVWDRICRQCRRVKLKHRYIYAVANAQELRNREAEE